MYFSKQNPLWRGTTQNLQMFLVSLHFLCAAHTLHCLGGYFFFPFPPPTIFSSLCTLKSPESLPGGSCLGSLLWQLNAIRTWLTLILDFWYPGPSYLMQEVILLYFVFSVLYTKNALKSTQFSRYSTTFFWPFYSFLQNWVITEVLVSPVYVLYEFIVLENSISLLYFHVCFPVFHPCVYNCCIMDSTYHSHKSCPSTLAPLHHHSSWTLTSLFSSTCVPTLGHVECPC